jgi:hypothetical protein
MGEVGNTPKVGGSRSHRFSLTDTPSGREHAIVLFSCSGISPTCCRLAFGRARLRYWLSQKGRDKAARDSKGCRSMRIFGLKEKHDEPSCNSLSPDVSWHHGLASTPRKAASLGMPSMERGDEGGVAVDGAKKGTDWPTEARGEPIVACCGGHPTPTSPPGP